MQKIYKISSPRIIPCVPVVLSTLQLTLTDAEGNSQSFEDKASLSSLVQRYGITIEGDCYDLTNLNGLTCTLLGKEIVILQS